MTEARQRELAAVRIDARDERAWLGEVPLDLTPRAFAVLRRLVERAGRLVTKDDLLVTVWRDAVVSDAALASCVRDLRRALGDSSDTPRYIETAPRRGFRFIGPVAAPGDAAQASPDGADGEWTPPAFKPPVVVGRDADLARLRRHLDRAGAGRRQMIFVTGEPGIGKTALVERFLGEAGAERTLRIGRGQCVEQYGAGEAYLPVLEALGRLGRGAGSDGVLAALRRYAPTWLTHLPSLVSDAEWEAVQRRAHGATRERMLRELVEALEAMTASELLVLLLEDLHWSDASTIDLLARLARRPDPAHLLVIGTHRPGDLAAGAHPLRSAVRELTVHGHAEELPLPYLDAAAVADYLATRLGRHELPSRLAPALHRNTGGNPLFVVSTVDDLVARGRLAEIDGRWQLRGDAEDVAAELPETLRQIVERQVERLDPGDRAVLRVACVAGAEWSAAIAAAGGIAPEDAEARCEALARRGPLLRAAGVADWPDGTVAARYAFAHAVYQQALYAHVPAAERAALHLAIGQRLEQAHGARAAEIAGELAVHFEHGRDPERAARYRRAAGEHALAQHGYQEAAEHAARALALIASRPDGAVRAHGELEIQMLLGAALTATRGYAAPEVARCYVRASELCERVGDAARRVPVLLGLGRFHLSRGEMPTARGVGERLLASAEAAGDPAVALAARSGLGTVAFYSGAFREALAHVEQGLALYDPERSSAAHSPAFRAGQDPGVTCSVYVAWAHQMLGRPDRAAERMRAALALARSLAHPFTLAYACHFAAGLHLVRREIDAAEPLEREASALASEHGLRLFELMGDIQLGAIDARRGREGGLGRMRAAIGTLADLGIELRRPAFLALFAEALAEAGRTGEAREAIAEGLSCAARTGQRYWDAELRRLRGAGAAEGEADLVEALRIAREQASPWLELRAATALARRAATTSARRARAALAAACAAFDEGADTADLADARALLDPDRA